MNYLDDNEKSRLRAIFEADQTTEPWSPSYSPLGRWREFMGGRKWALRRGLGAAGVLAVASSLALGITKSSDQTGELNNLQGRAVGTVLRDPEALRSLGLCRDVLLQEAARKQAVTASYRNEAVPDTLGAAEPTVVDYQQAAALAVQSKVTNCSPTDTEVYRVTVGDQTVPVSRGMIVQPNPTNTAEPQR